MKVCHKNPQDGRVGVQGATPGISCILEGTLSFEEITSFIRFGRRRLLGAGEGTGRVCR